MARAFLADARVLYGIVVVVATDIGLVVGLWTRPWHFWYPPMANTLWMVAWLFVAAFVGTLPKRAHPVSSMPSRVIVAVLLALPAGVALLGGWRSSGRISLGEWLVIGSFLTVVSIVARDLWHARRDRTAIP